MPIYLKRLGKEIELFNNKKNFDKYNKNIQNFYNNLNIIEYISDNNVTFLDFKDNNNNLLLTLKVSNYYPFKPYEFVYNNITNKLNKYNSYFKNIQLLNEKKIFDPNILKFFFILQYGFKSKFINLKHNDCYCCNSLYCLKNWNPSFTFEDIIIEYMEIKFITKYSKPYTYLYILNIYHNFLNIILNKIPQDIIDIILQYSFYKIY